MQRIIHILLEKSQSYRLNCLILIQQYAYYFNISLNMLFQNSECDGAVMVSNNEIGFSAQNIEALCSVGASTKANMKKQGYIGEKGIGFKSVFLVCLLYILIIVSSPDKCRLPTGLSFFRMVINSIYLLKKTPK